MKINLKKILFILLVILPVTVSADKIYLNNGKTIEGIVERNDDSQVVLYVGSGRITLNKDEIKDIENYGYLRQQELLKEWRYRYFTNSDFVPDGLKDLAVEFDALEKVRKQAKEDLQSQKEYDENIASLTQENTKLKNDSLKMTKKLASLNSSQKFNEYNQLVKEINKLAAKIKINEHNIELFKANKKSLTDNVRDYVEQLTSFRNLLRYRYQEASSKDPTERVEDFFKVANKRLDEMDEDFSRNVVPYNRFGSSIVVEVLINDSTKANLVLDTGATLVVISKKVFNDLNIADSKKGEKVDVKLADGRITKAIPLILDKLKIGKVEAVNVQAAVIEDSLPTEEDGLLGMSFLKNFIVRLDSNNKILIFEEFKD